MARPTHVYIVGSPRPRVGKTLLARALTEFYRVDGRPVSAFDLDHEENSLIDFLPKFAVRANITDTRGQMALFDQLIVGDEKPKVIDLSAHLFDAFLTVMSDIEFVSEARKRSIEPIVLFIASPGDRSAKCYADLPRRVPGLNLVPIYNQAIAQGAHLRDSFPPRAAVALPIQLPALSPTLRHIVDARPFSFAEFKRQPSPNLPVRLADELNSWMKRLFIQFRELELRLLLSNLRGSLQPLEIDQPSRDQQRETI